MICFHEKSTFSIQKESKTKNWNYHSIYYQQTVELEFPKRIRISNPWIRTYIDYSNYPAYTDIRDGYLYLDTNKIGFFPVFYQIMIELCTYFSVKLVLKHESKDNLQIFFVKSITTMYKVVHLLVSKKNTSVIWAQQSSWRWHKSFFSWNQEWD